MPCYIAVLNILVQTIGIGSRIAELQAKTVLARSEDVKHNGGTSRHWTDYLGPLSKILIGPYALIISNKGNDPRRHPTIYIMHTRRRM